MKLASSSGVVAASVAAIGALSAASAFAAPASAGPRLIELLTLSDYNTRVVTLGVTLLGIASGVVGGFLLLRKRALLGDVVSHATLPGIAAAFIVTAELGAVSKSLPVLLGGGVISATLGVLAVLAIVRFTRLKEDAALGIVLSVFFGAGVAGLGIIQKMQVGHAAGLQSFIYGKTASMVASDAALIAIVSAMVIIGCWLLRKELRLLCFDPQFAAAQGWPVLVLDVVLMGLVVALTVIGLQAVGLILMVALLIIPPAAARFWTQRLGWMVVVAGVLGGVCGFLGAAVSALAPRLPAGAVIVLVAGGAFALSLLIGPARGVVFRLAERWRLQAKVFRQHLLRAMYELSDHPSRGTAAVTIDDLLRARSWSRRRLARVLRQAEQCGWIRVSGSTVELTEAGRTAAWRLTRNHRLWELYLITHADIAPSHVDRDADQVEHVLDPSLVAELERALSRTHPDLAAPPSPHSLAGAATP